MTFRDRLLATLRAVEPVLEVRGVLVAGSEVPNLLEVDAASTLVVSQNVDLTIPISVHEEVKARLDQIELRHQILSNLSILSLLETRSGMPDPRPQRPIVAGLLRRLESR